MDGVSLYLMRYFRDRYARAGKHLTVLDIGSRCVNGEATYRDVFNKGFHYTGMDIVSGENVDIVGYKNLPEKYDIVISGQVMEHVKRPWDWLKNLALYAKESVCIIAPNTHGEHRFPIDTYRYFPDGMRDLFEYANIHVFEIFKKGKLTIGIGRPE